ncbi:EGF-like domain containing protein, partial [Aphelenchoides avenae]
IRLREQRLGEVRRIPTRDERPKPGRRRLRAVQMQTSQRLGRRHLCLPMTLCLVHGTISDGKCKCKESWKGPICNEFIGCPEKYSLYNAVCTPNACQHGGELAIGSKHLECICKPPWDGRWCERLACWRMGPKEQERRWRNAEDHCRCADGFKGDNCDEIAFCKNGELVSGRCICAEGWKGEVCERKCIPDQTCTASAIVLQLTSLLILLSVALYLR